MNSSRRPLEYLMFRKLITTYTLDNIIPDTYVTGSDKAIRRLSRGVMIMRVFTAHEHENSFFNIGNST